MLKRQLQRWMSVVGIAGYCAGAAAACGSGASTSHSGSGVGGNSFTTSTGHGGTTGEGGSDSGIQLEAGPGACTPSTCAEAGYTCGMNGDGCGGVLDCGTCSGLQFCGGGGYSICGGGPPTTPDGSIISPCTPDTCATAPSGPYNCGMTGDGCGGTLDCGSCPASQFCGGGGFNQCGGSTGLGDDGGVPCTPTTTCPAGQNCGQAADGCGGLINCGSCTNPEFCGGGGPSVCGGNNGLAPDGGATCTPTTTCPTGQNCGYAADGCGGLISCGSCTNPEFCGGKAPNECGGNNGLTPDGSILCTPTTCALLGNPCGKQSDGCGGVLNCTQCVNPQTCGGGGVPNQCGGNNGVSPDGGLLCTPKTCANFPGTCGVQADGCGGVTTNCGSCAAPDTCGGGGTPSQCGNSNLLPDGGNPCTPKTTCPTGTNCGEAADGCGGIINCGTCTSPFICGGGGVSGQCGHTGLAPDGGVLCTPTTCAKLGYTCGTIGDGCGGTLNCGTCTDPQFCGGGGPSICGGNNGLTPDGSVACTPTTCAKLGYTCGEADDGCGNILDCGGTAACTSPQYCGGGGYNICGPSILSTCTGGAVTKYTGYVYDPGNNLPVSNALVYVPVGAVVVPTNGVNAANPQCGCTAPAAYASAYTAIDGSFTLTNLPTGTAVNIVVQLGKWQRQFAQNITACVSNTASNGTFGTHLTLPSTHLQGNIPLFAVDTGAVDSMECVLMKMGIAQSEFINPVITGGVPAANGGRIHLYQGSVYDGGAIINTSTPAETTLVNTASTINAYDVVLFPCQGGAGTYSSTALSNLVNYANDGGRFFATHYHYDLLEGNGEFNALATWAAEGSNAWGDYYSDPTYNMSIDQTFTRGVTFASWMHQTAVYGGTNTLGTIPVGVVREDTTAINAPAQRWLYSQNDTGAGGPPAGVNIHATFDTPVGGTACGRGVYSDFHVESQVNGNSYHNVVFPNECPGGALTIQEKVLEYFLFDLTSCVSAPTCTPKTCSDFPGECGVQGDGCGGVTANCGSCPSPQTCGGGGVPNHCGYPDGGACAPESCATLGFNCGEQGNGCGGTQNCGTCTAPATCGGGGVPGQCGYPDAGCTKLTCASYPAGTCGVQTDGCGGVTANCNPCTAPATCGGGGVPNQCGFPDAGACVPETCASQGAQCGFVSNGCGGISASCGTCPPGSGCSNNICVAIDAGSACVAKNCAQLGIQCGDTDDGCGNLLTCATCPGGESCIFNQCIAADGGACKPLTCANFPSTTCGEQGDGCGGFTANCNPCTAPQTCGGGGVPNQCGFPDAGACTALTCADFAQTVCGPQADGCGGVTAFCNPCTAPATCGGGGTANECGYPDGGSCVPQTCSQQNLGCGPAGDGCGDVIQCGTCPSGQTCGGGGTPSQCGTYDAGTCVPLTCSGQNISCGPAGDGCGNLLQCGTCSNGQTCGGGGTPGKCGGGSQ